MQRSAIHGLQGPSRGLPLGIRLAPLRPASRRPFVAQRALIRCQSSKTSDGDGERWGVCKRQAGRISVRFVPSRACARMARALSNVPTTHAQVRDVPGARLGPPRPPGFGRGRGRARGDRRRHGSGPVGLRRQARPHRRCAPARRYQVGTRACLLPGTSRRSSLIVPTRPALQPHGGQQPHDFGGRGRHGQH